MKIQDINEAPDRLYNIQQMLYKTLEEYSTPDCPLYGNLYAYHASDVAGSDLNRLYLVMGRDPQCAGPDWPKGLDPVAAIRSQERDPLLFHTNVKVIDLTNVEDELNLSGIIVVDFINMEKKEQRQQLLAFLSEQCKKDRINCQVIDMTALGLVEMIRSKGRKPLHEQMRDVRK